MIKINMKFLTIFCVLLAVFGKDLPSSFEKCKRNEKNFDQCLVGAVNKAIVLLKNGLPDFGLAPLEPLRVKTLIIDNGSNSPVNIKQTYKNVVINHLIGSSKVLKYKTDLNRYQIICESQTNKIEILGDYEMSGRILLIPIVGRGKANLTLHNSLITHRLIGEPTEKDGEIYMKLKHYKVEINPKRVYINYENLFGDKILSDNLNKFLNENWELIFGELKKGYADAFENVFKDITNNIFTKVPMDKLFLK